MPTQDLTRRDFISQTAAIGITTGLSVGAAPNDREYEICKQRGHVATIWGNTHGVISSPAVFTITPDRPSQIGYNLRTETSWETCFYCKRQFRFVTTMEEQ